MRRLLALLLISLVVAPGWAQLPPKLLTVIDRRALLAGMLDLVAAVQRLQHFVTTQQHLPELTWTLDTPMGQIVVDTTGRDNPYRLKDPLLLLDVGGDDQYEFCPAAIAAPISVLLDHQGNDRYIAVAAGSEFTVQCHLGAGYSLGHPRR